MKKLKQKTLKYKWIEENILNKKKLKFMPGRKRENLEYHMQEIDKNNKRKISYIFKGT